MFAVLDSTPPLFWALQAVQRLLPAQISCTRLPLAQHGVACPHLVRVRASAAGAVSKSSSASAANGWLFDKSTLSSSSSRGGAASTATTSGSNGTSRSSSYDAIMMLGGGLLPDGGMPEWVLRRLEGCLHLYQAHAELEDSSSSSSSSNGSSSNSRGVGSRSAAARRPAIVLLGAGTPHKPPVIDAGGYVLHESTAYADYLISRGVPAVDLLKEAQSYDTVGNGYFSLLQHALPAGWRWVGGHGNGRSGDGRARGRNGVQQNAKEDANRAFS